MCIDCRMCYIAEVEECICNNADVRFENTESDLMEEDI